MLHRCKSVRSVKKKSEELFNFKYKNLGKHQKACRDCTKKEVITCVVRCSNCHRRKTARQFGWSKNITAPIAQLDRAHRFGR